MELGLRTKVTAAIALPIALIAVVFAFYLPSLQADAADSMMDSHAISTSKLLGDVVTTSLERGSAEDVRQNLEMVSDEPDILYAAVYTVDGQLFRDYRAEGIGVETMKPGAAQDVETEEDGGVLHVRVPIRVITGDSGATRMLGTLVVGFSRQQPQELRADSQSIAIVISLVIFAAGLLLAWAVSGTIARPLLKTSEQLTEVANDLLSAARAREASAAEEAAAVEETRRTMDMLLSSAQKIADSASVVLGNAERTLDGNREIAERIEQLNRHAEKVAEILASIMQVADRTDLLALNAALEGTKAGEAGKGFTLVAKEMRRLAENVMESVEGIRRLMRDVREASQEAVHSSHDGTQFSEETTRSVREIALVTQQQRKATEQVSRSMDEMTELLNHAMADIKQTTRSAAALSELAIGLAGLINAKGPGAPPAKARERKAG